jgi:flagellin
MESQIRGLQQAVRNSADAVSLLQTADGASIEIGDMLQRMRELAVQARNGSNQSSDITNLNKEFSALATEIDRIANVTEFNGIQVLKGDITSDKLEFVVGKDKDDIMTVNFSDFNLGDGAAKISEVVGSVDMARAQTGTTTGALGADLTGTIFLSDGSNQISIVLDDVNNAFNTTTITAKNATQTQVATAINVAADANASFRLNVAGNGTTGLTFVEKTGFGGAQTMSGTYTGSGSAVTVTIAGSTAGTTGGVMGVDLSAFATSSTNSVSESGTIGQIDVAIAGVAQARADFGAVINTLEHSVDNLNNSIQNTQAAKSAIMDADYAAETTELARTQIISQAATAMLSQANQQAQSVLALLK